MFHVFWIAFFSQITECETEHVIPNRRLSLYKNTMDSKKFSLSTIIALKGEKESITFYMSNTMGNNNITDSIKKLSSS